MSTPQPPEGYFTAEQVAEQVKTAELAALEKARTEERDKLYGKIRQTDDRYQQMDAEVKRLTDLEAQRQKDIEKAARVAETAKQKAAEAEMSAKDLLAQREQSWQQKLDEMAASQATQMAKIAEQQTLQQAMWDKEREMQALQIYIRDAVAAESDNIAPELLDFIGGDTKEQVDASIQRVKEKTAAIVEGMRQAQIQQRSGMPGVASSGGATAITPGLDTGDQVLTPEAIKGMSMQEFAALRSKMNLPSGQGRGIFG